MSDRIRWFTDWVAIHCSDCDLSERVEKPTPDQQKALLRRGRQHALGTGHQLSVERGQLSWIDA